MKGESMRYYIGLCLLLAGNAVSQQEEIQIQPCRGVDIAYLRELYKDPEKLKEGLMDSLSSYQYFAKGQIPYYKKRLGITDDTLRITLMEMYQKFKHLEKDAITNKDYSYELVKDKWRLINSIELLGYCADESVKRLLLDIANDETKAKCYRIPAVSSSIQCADAQEVRDVIIRFIVDVKIGTYSTWQAAFSVYGESKDDPQKREAILATLIVLLARENGKMRFADMDKKVADRSKEYATSAQRLAMVKRMSKFPPEPNNADSFLKNALDSFHSRVVKTNVSTNMTELMARDFRKSE